jgi:predicted metal-dependent hydrolase
MVNVVPLDKSALELGIDLFNEGRYFDAHEAWEGLWLRAKDAQDKSFFQGLIMAAGAFLHAEKRECTGAAKLLVKSVPLLKSGADAHPDLLLGDFIRALEKLESDKDWCATGAGAMEVPRIRREPAHDTRE